MRGTTASEWHNKYCHDGEYVRDENFYTKRLSDLRLCELIRGLSKIGYLERFEHNTLEEIANHVVFFNNKVCVGVYDPDEVVTYEQVRFFENVSE